MSLSRVFGFAVGAVWLILASLTLRNSLEGWSAGHSDLGFWWGVVTGFLLLAAGVAIVGTVRYRYQGPRK